MRKSVVRLVTVILTLALLATGAIASGASAQAASTASPMSATGRSYAKTVLKVLNKERAEHGLKRLRLTDRLTRSAATHNRAMAKTNTISHQLGGERDFVARIHKAGWRYRCATGENIGVNADLSRAGAVQLQTLMYGETAPNDGHRINILNRRYSHVGIAVLFDAHNHRLWLTFDFGQRHC